MERACRGVDRRVILALSDVGSRHNEVDVDIRHADRQGSPVLGEFYLAERGSWNHLLQLTSRYTVDRTLIQRPRPKPLPGRSDGLATEQ
jgi:hypothetical protein